MANTRHQSTPPIPHLGGKAAIALFVFTLFAFVFESQLTQYVQADLGYRQPFFIFYCVHSAFALVFPLHVLFLLATTNCTLRGLFIGLRIAITHHLSPEATPGGKDFPLRKFGIMMTFMSIGLTMPGLLWFMAVSLAPLTDVTALWNANAFWAYVFSVWFFRLKIETRKLGAVLLATAGALAVVYGGATSSEDGDSTTPKPSAPLAGDLLTLMASLLYGLYQVLYKKYAALPSDPEYEPLHSDLARSGSYESISSMAGVEPVEEGSAHGEQLRDIEYPPPFGLFPNLLTSLVGVITWVVLGFGIPLLHVFEIEKFRAPSNVATTMGIAGIAFGGMIFNAGFMILLGIWGPIVASVANLLTIVLMYVSDLLFGAGVIAMNLFSVTGSLTIVGAFAVLALDMIRDNGQAQ